MGFDLEEFQMQVTIVEIILAFNLVINITNFNLFVR